MCFTVAARPPGTFCYNTNAITRALTDCAAISRNLNVRVYSPGKNILRLEATAESLDRVNGSVE